ncbi:MAG: hypothetical protein ABMA64_01415 [Myxococcota bacterium]
MWWVIGLGCTGGGGDGCALDAEPTLTLGYGVGGYTPIPDGGEFPLVHGPQGGYHLELGLLATGLDATNLVVGHVEGTLHGEPFASADPWLDFRCDDALGGLVSYGTRLIYDAQPSALDGQPTEVTVEVADPRGGTLTGAAEFTIRDDP